MWEAREVLLLSHVPKASVHPNRSTFITVYQYLCPHTPRQVCRTGDVQPAMQGEGLTDGGELWHLEVPPENVQKGREVGQR